MFSGSAQLSLVVRTFCLVFLVLIPLVAFSGLEELVPPSCGVFDEGVPGAPRVVPVPRAPVAAPALTEATPVRAPDMAWVESTLSGLTLDEKIGQMMMPWYGSGSASDIATYKVGGFIFSSFNTSGAASVVQAVNDLQALSSVPLWFAADFEIGAGARFGEATVFPMNMGVGAADDEILAASMGWVTAREAWAMGIQVGFGPVVDVNTDPANPIIATRSYGDRQTLVARMARAFVDGAHRGGMLTTLKHYPGHGPTDQDSHLTLPVVSISEQELRSIHLYPYERLIQQGFSDLVMTAHVWFKALDPGEQPWPATLSYRAMTEILRGELGYTGVAISDAFSMAGVQGILEPAEAIVTAIKNGLDIILVPPDLAVATSALKAAVQSGEIPLSQIDNSVRRILMAKSRMWLPEARYRDEAVMWSTLKHPTHLAIAEQLGRASITRVFEQPGVLPLRPEHKVLCLRLENLSIIFNVPPRSPANFTDRLAAELPQFDLRVVPRSMTQSQINTFVAAAAAVDRVVVAGYDWKPITSSSQLTLMSRLVAGPTPVIYISFGNPYHGLQMPGLENFYCAYANAEVSQWAGADALLGKLEPQGKLPVSVYGLPVVGWQGY